MASFKLPENVSTDEFFKSELPRQFKEMTAGLNLSALGNNPFTLQFNLDSKKYCLSFKAGEDLKVIAGGIDKPILTIALSEADYRDCLTGKLTGIIDRFTDPGQVADAQRYSLLTSTNGTLNVDLRKPGNNLALSLIFNASAAPAVTIKLSLEDWVAMQNKQVDGQTLVMGGKMNFDGDMMFLMGLQQLL